MTGRIGTEVAWALLRSLSVGAGAAGPGRAEVAGAWLELGPEGWRASAEPTEAAHDLVELFLPVVRSRELVIGQLGQSLDGRIATESGASHYVTGPEDVERLHRLRALVDAVVVGAETVVADDPRLTVRAAEGPDPARVVIDPRGRVDPGARIFDGRAPALVVGAGPKGGGAPHPAASAGVAEELRLPRTGTGAIDPMALVDALRARGLSRLLVEGGGVTVSGFLASGALDRLHVTVAPLIIGSGRPSLTLAPIEALHEALRPPCRCFRLGSDVLFDLDLRAERG